MVGWATEGNGVGEWTRIMFSEDILISKVVYTHGPYAIPDPTALGARIVTEAYNQNFKDVSFEFSDGSRVNVTLDDTWDDMYFTVNPPKSSSSLKITANSVYKHPKICENGTGTCKFETDRYGISKLRIYGVTTVGKYKFNCSKLSIIT